MDQEELIHYTRKKLDDMNYKIQSVRERDVQHAEEKIKQRSRAVLQRMVIIRDEIKDQFTVLSQSGEKNESLLSELERYIYVSARSFDSAYSKAGSLFKVH